MAKSRIKSQMTTPFGTKPTCGLTEEVAPVGGMTLITKVHLGSTSTPTPTQTAGNATRTSRPGTRQFGYGKNST